MAQDENSSRRSDQIRARRVERVRRTVLPDSGQTPRRTPRRTPSRHTGQTMRRMEASIPPVMVRSPSLGPAASGRKSSRAKRRYDVPVGAAGAEMRLPSLPSVAIGWRLISFVLLCVLGFLAYQVWNSPKYKVSDIKVGGLQRVSSREVTRALDVMDTQVFLLNSRQMEQDLQSAFPEFSAVTVEVSLPASVVVTVTERVPVIAWVYEGHTTLVDKDGIGFPLRNGMTAPTLSVDALSPPPGQAAQDPLKAVQAASEKAKDNAAHDSAGSGDLAEPEPGKPFLTPEMVSAVQFLAKQVPGEAHLVYDSKHGLGWKDPRGWNAYFGDAQDAAMKLNVYNAIVQRLLAEEIQPALISVEHVHAPYYRVD